jgi:hypothetical protein
MVDFKFIYFIRIIRILLVDLDIIRGFELCLLSLSLFMLGIFTDNTNAPFAADDFAIFTNFLNTGSNLHMFLASLKPRYEKGHMRI